MSDCTRTTPLLAEVSTEAINTLPTEEARKALTTATVSEIRVEPSQKVPELVTLLTQVISSILDQHCSNPDKASSLKASLESLVERIKALEEVLPLPTPWDPAVEEIDDPADLPESPQTEDVKNAKREVQAAYDGFDDQRLRLSEDELSNAAYEEVLRHLWDIEAMMDYPHDK